MLPAPAVVEAAAQLAVVDGRGAAGRPGLDVIALAAFPGPVTAVQDDQLARGDPGGDRAARAGASPLVP
jgi:hypothetical protein